GSARRPDRLDVSPTRRARGHRELQPVAGADAARHSAVRTVTNCVPAFSGSSRANTHRWASAGVARVRTAALVTRIETSPARAFVADATIGVSRERDRSAAGETSVKER